MLQRRKKQQWKATANDAALEISRLHEKLLAKGESITSLEARLAVMEAELQLLAAAGLRPAASATAAASVAERAASPGSAGAGRRPLSSRSRSRRAGSGNSGLKPVAEAAGEGGGEGGVMDMSQLRLQLEEAWGEVDAAGKVCSGLDEEVEQVEAAKQALLVSHDQGMCLLKGVICEFYWLGGNSVMHLPSSPPYGIPVVLAFGVLEHL